MSRSASGRIVRSAGVLAAATGVSRLLGFVRDILMARLFGTSAQAQAFVVAFRLPNLLRDLVAEGAVASAIVPTFSPYRLRGDAQGLRQISQALLSRLLVLLGAIGAAGVLAAPWIVRLVAPGFVTDPEKFALTVLLTRILFPFITLVGLWAFFMGYLNTVGHFALPALGPAILNLSMIAGCLWLVPRTSPGVVALAAAVVIGGVIQLVIQIPAAVRQGFVWRWRWRSAGTTTALRLLGPRIVGSAVYQANVMIDTILASLGSVVGDGAVAALYFANRLVQLPLALFGTASAQASLPALAEQSASGDLEAFARTLRSVLRMVAFVILPASAGLIVLAGPIVTGLFQRGAFDRHASQMTTIALSYYSLGLLAFSANKVLTGAFYALHDTRTPVRLAVEVVVMNVALCLALMWPMRIGGLALAAAVSNSVNAVRLARRMERRLKRPLLGPLRDPLLRMAAASLLMGAACWGLWRAAGFDASPLPGLCVAIPASVGVYLAACWGLRIQELASARRWLSKLPPLSLFVNE
ncbi:MAG: murein biosynthesis integral membrane protein MurJ [Candidatus Omnitrophica bacterium]|nr:murein biosynthesis integral membrane protein MurJ [Candidatus Omnitrophota bacterium]